MEVDFRQVRNILLFYRKKRGLTQVAVAEAAGISDRTYADIERSSVNMRIETLLQICEVLKITPNDLLIAESENETPTLNEIIEKLNSCSQKELHGALSILNSYLEVIR